jgi:hypothetical protein
MVFPFAGFFGRDSDFPTGRQEQTGSSVGSAG